jgi:hypothetical protein
MIPKEPAVELSLIGHLDIQKVKRFSGISAMEIRSPPGVILSKDTLRFIKDYRWRGWIGAFCGTGHYNFTFSSFFLFFIGFNK